MWTDALENAQRMRKKPCWLRQEAPSVNNKSTPPTNPPIATLSTPPTTATPTPPPVETPPQPGCFVLAAPEELDIPSRLKGAAWPYNYQWYAAQLPSKPLVSASADNSRIYVESLFPGVEKPSPWPKKFPPFSPLQGEIPPVLALAPQFGTTVTRVEVTVHKVKVIAILNTGSPVNVISSRLARKINMAPDLDHSLV